MWSLPIRPETTRPPRVLELKGEDLTVPNLRCARQSALLLCVLTVGVGLAPAGASARAFGRQSATRSEERALAHEERLRSREERRQQRQVLREERARGRGESKVRGEGRARPNSASGSAGCTLTMVLGAPRIIVGEDVHISGRLTCPEPEQAAGQTVTAYRSGEGSGRSAVATASTEPDGGYELTVTALQENSLLSVRAGLARSSRLPVAVAPWVTISDPPGGSQLTSRLAGVRHAGASRTVFSGTVDPRFAGRRVALQRSYDPAGEQWRTIKLGRVDDEGNYTLAHFFRTPGQTWIRVVVHPPRGNVAGISEALSYDVLAAQNPNLTIESSTTLAVFGQPVTISGVAGGPSQTVTLLRTSRGGAPQTVAETTTDESGHYSFSLVPQQTGYYEARDATTSSIALPVHVGFQLTLTAPTAVPPAATPTAVAGQPVTIEGTIAPATAGERVLLEAQSRSGLHFHAIASGTVEESSFSIVHAFPVPRGYRLRIRALARDGVEATAGAPFSLQVDPAG